MVLRIPWDKQETALLIDAYLKVKNKELFQQEAIKEVSTLLRRRAVLLGIEIDEIFRNENGISMQMNIVGSLIDEKPSGLHVTKMFTDMVALYKTRRSEFDEILIQAKRECIIQVNIQDRFLTWLSKRVSSMQLSEFYIVYRDIETFCMNRHILVAPLFETTDFEILQYITNTIRTNKMFQSKHFHQLGKMKKAMEYYLMFLHENPVQKEAQVSTVKEEEISVENVVVEESVININSEIVEQEEVVAETVSIKHKIDTISTENDDDNFIWNFANESINFTFINPIEVSYFGESRVCYGWQSAFVYIIRFLQEDYPSIIRGMVGYHFSGVGKVVLTGRVGLDRLSKAKEINDGLYLETDCTPDEIITIVRLLMNKCNMDYDNIEITYEKYQVENSSVVIDDSSELSIDNSKNEDPTMIAKTMEGNENSSNEGVQDYIVQILDEIFIPYIDNRNNNGCLWILGDMRLSPVFEKLAQYTAEFHYKADGGRATKGEPAWWTKDIIEKQASSKNIETKNKVIIASALERKSDFENWLISGKGFAKYLAQSYSSAVNIAGQYSVRLGFSKKELYFILDAKQVYQISKKLLANSEFAQLNDSQHNLYHAALLKYWNYCNVIAGKTIVKASVKVVPEQEDEVKKNRIAFIEWAQAQQMQKAAILSYLSDIKKCSEFAKENDYIKEEHILLIEDVNVLERVFLKMRKDSRFVTFSNEKQKRPISAMNKLIAFRRATGNRIKTAPASIPQIKPVEKTIRRPIVSVETSDLEPQVKERYTEILAENFVDGFRPTKAIDRNRFRMHYSDMFGQELTDEDEQLVCTLMKVGTLRDERIFVKDETEQKDLLEEINETILQTFKEGASCIYLDCLFVKFQEQLAEMLHVYNVDSLESVLFSSKKRNYYKRYNYLFENNIEPAPARDVIEYMKKSHLPVTYSEIENGLWYIPLDKIKHTLVTTPGIVNVASETYLYAPNLPVSVQEIQKITELIGHALLQRSYISDVELMQLIDEHCPSVLMNTQNYPIRGLRNALAYLFREKFSFRGAIISNKDEEIRMAEVFSDFCRRSEHITVDELKNFASELNTAIYWDSVYDEMIRINQNEFIHRDQIHFDIEQIDAVLDNLIPNAYTPIKTINLFLHFPVIDVPWNNFVLESYAANYSKKFKLLHANYTANDCYGAVVRRKSSISDYKTLIVDVLSKNAGWKNKKDALQLLVDLGYQQRKSYGNIEKVMQEAKVRMSTPKK